MGTGEGNAGVKENRRARTIGDELALSGCTPEIKHDL